MIPDNVEKIIMTKEDYDRNIEQLLYDKVNAELEVERLNNNWNKLEEWLNIQQNISSSEQILNDIFNKIQKLKGSDKE